MSLDLPINRQFLDQLYKQNLLLLQETRNELCFIPKHKHSYDISI